MSNDSKKQWTTRRGAQPVSDFVSKLLDPVIERRAGMTMDLIASWEEIVGEKHAARSRPEKLQWSRRGGEIGGAFSGETATHDRGQEGFEPATLVIACDGGHALFMQHDSDAILGQVNDYFGFFAVSRLRLVQKPIVSGQAGSASRRAGSTPRGQVGELAAEERKRLDGLVGDVENDDLKKALEKLGRGVFSQGSSEDG